MKSTFQLAETLANLVDDLRDEVQEQFDFTSISWSQLTATGSGTSGPTALRVSLDFNSAMVRTRCSICGLQQFCPHSTDFAVIMLDSGVADAIEQSAFADCTFVIKPRELKKRQSNWKSQLGRLVQQFGTSPSEEPAPVRFPPGREAIYVIQQTRFAVSSGVLEIQVGTRPIEASVALVRRSASTNSSNKIYRTFASGVRALAASQDPLDREVAEKIALKVHSYDYYQSRQELQFSVPLETSSDLMLRLARSGRLYHNSRYSLHDGITQLGFLSDERFDAKFQIAAEGKDQLSLGACVVNSQMLIPQDQIKSVSTWFFFDRQDRLGLFRRPVPLDLIGGMTAGKPILVPRKQAKELIEKVMKIPAGMGIEFVECDDVRPQRERGVPTPHIHIKAPAAASTTLEAEVRFGYGEKMIPIDRRVEEFYDKRRSTVVQVDNDSHQRSIELLTSMGAKVRQRYGNTTVTLGVKKLPAMVGQLIHHGWRVEADGKLYRTASNFDISVVSGIDWFELQGKAHFDQQSIDLPRLLQSLRSGERTVILDDGTVGVIPEQWVKQFGGLAGLGSTEDGSLKFGRSQVGLLDALLAQQGVVNVDEKFNAAREALRAFDRIVPRDAPQGFIGSLRPYQQLAQGWFGFLRGLGFGGCLADDMGLGKTIQVLALLEHRRQLNSGPSLIVVPRSLIFNWTAEARKFAPQLRVLDQSHSQRQRGTEHLTDYDLVLTTYGTLRRDAAFLKDFEFDYVVLDEAQAIKNATTEASKAARLLKGRHKLALSGTPIENHLGELWSLFDFLNPGMLGRVGRFSNLAQDANVDQRQLLAAAVRPFILRRTKQQVAPELPERVEQTIVVELDAEQRKSYDELREYYRQMLMNKIDADGIGKSQMVILEALLRLRQAACHPGLVDKTRIAEPSAKVDELITRLTSATETGERVLVFSQFTSLLAIVKLRLKQAKIDFLYLDGKTRDRQALVEQFQSGKGPPVFLISLKAGGVGLNLTAARTVYLLDPWWNPAVEAQAIDRTHRIGQQQTVFATRLIAADTVEQKVLELQSKKKGLADAIVNADNAGISSLTREDLELLLA